MSNHTHNANVQHGKQPEGKNPEVQHGTQPEGTDPEIQHGKLPAPDDSGTVGFVPVYAGGDHTPADDTTSVETSEDPSGDADPADETETPTEDDTDAPTEDDTDATS